MLVLHLILLLVIVINIDKKNNKNAGDNALIRPRPLKYYLAGNLFWS